MAEPIIEVNNLAKYFSVTRGLFHQSKIADVKAVDGVSFTIHKGETLGLVGESGCGKTTLGKCILQLIRPTSGEVIFEGRDLCEMTDRELVPVRAKLQMIFQDPYDSLDPRFTATDIIGEPLRIHHISKGKEYDERIAELLNLVGLAPYMGERYPHEFSGGQRQRLGIARALALQPQFIMCDEPISALDVSIQAQIINLLDDLQQKFGVSYLFISHDLSVVRHLSDRVVVMYLGKIMEISNRDELYKIRCTLTPRHCSGGADSGPGSRDEAGSHRPSGRSTQPDEPAVRLCLPSPVLPGFRRLPENCPDSRRCRRWASGRLSALRNFTTLIKAIL